jgi:DNA invertase Pin-like site-specific DNA recombinase
MKAIILARVSTKEQEDGHSIAAQRQRLVDYCARKGLKVIKTYELVESSTRGERKELAAILAFAQAQNETVAASSPMPLTAFSAEGIGAD